MKKVILSSLVAIFALAAQAQNVQLHYDFGRNIYSDEEAGRQKVTLTLEQFKADRFGSWYYFVDFRPQPQVHGGRLYRDFARVQSW